MMRAPAQQLLIQSGDHVVEVERSLLLRHRGMEDDLQEEIACFSAVLSAGVSVAAEAIMEPPASPAATTHAKTVLAKPDMMQFPDLLPQRRDYALAPPRVTSITGDSISQGMMDSPDASLARPDAPQH